MPQTVAIHYCALTTATDWRALAYLALGEGQRSKGQRFCQTVRQRALREFDERVVIRQTLAVYGELLGGWGLFAAEWVEIGGRLMLSPCRSGVSSY